MEHAIFWEAYGCTTDLGDLPVREYDAHVAILEGRNMKAREEQERQRREAERP